MQALICEENRSSCFIMTKAFRPIVNARIRETALTAVFWVTTYFCLSYSELQVLVIR